MHTVAAARAVLAATCAAALPIASRAQSATHAGHAPPAAAADERLGTIVFPTAAAAGARAAFVRGVLYLHNFHYPQAARAFREARAADPADAMSAAFEALSHTAPVWNLQDTAAARAALRRLAPTRAARAALARTPRERGWVDAVEELYYGDLPKAVRDSAFSRALSRLHAADPRDAEAATFYALSLLGLNQGDREPRAYAAAEAIVDSVLRAHPQHPGALHYKIHAVDDPANAARGLVAARAYGDVAPAAGHALHMTSHIYIALGMWDEVVAANRRAQATNAHAFGHGTHWLAYALLQQGRVREAREWVDSMLAYQREVAAGAATARGRFDVDLHAILMTATWVVDAEAWDAPLARVRFDTTHLRGPTGRTLAEFLVGYAAARRAGRPVDAAPGSRAADRLLADSMLARIAARNAAARAGSRPAQASAVGESEVMEKVLRAELAMGAGRADSALALLRRAGEQLEALPFAFGPPAVAKPPRERAGEILLAQGRHAEALAELDAADRMAPGRGQVALRRARALVASGQRGAGARVYAALAATWRGADDTLPWLAEARWGAGEGFAAERAASVAVDTVPYASGTAAAPLRLLGELVRPTDGVGRRPAVVHLHGSGVWDPFDVELLGRMFAARGYVSFFPYRRGQGLSAGQGEAILDQLRREGRLARDSAYAARSTELLATEQLADVRAAIAALRARPDVDSARVAVVGASYGGALTLLATEADPTLRAAVAFTPGAMNWGWNAPLRDRLTSAARRTRVPTLFVQAENDWHLGPSQVLPAAMQAAGGTAHARIYPAIGANVGTGHGLMVYAPHLWRDDVLAFLDRHVRGAP